MPFKAQADTDTGKPAASGKRGAGVRAGGQISGNLYRGTGGKFQAGPGAQLQDRLAQLRARMPKGKLRAKAGKGKRGKGKGAKPKQTPEQRTAAKEQQRLQNRMDALGKLSSKPNDAAMAALDALAKGDAVDPDMAAAIADETGLAERHADGSITLSAAGKKLLSSLDKGDAAGAAAAIAGAGDKQAKQDERAQAKEARRQAADKRKVEREKKGAAKKKAGGGGKPKAPPKEAPTPEETDQAKAETRAKNREAVTKKMMANDTGITAQGFNALSKLSDSGEMDKGTADTLESMGLVDRDTEGKPRVSAQGRKLLRAADKGDYDGALDAIAAGGDRAASRKQKARERAEKEKARAKEKAEKEKVRATDKANKEKLKAAQKERQTDRGLRSLSRGGKVGESQLLDMEDEGLIAFDKDNKPQLTDKGKKRLAARQGAPQAAPGPARQTTKAFEIKEQDASERAMFAKLDAAGKLRPKNKAGNRTKPRRAGGGGNSSASHEPSASDHMIAERSSVLSQHENRLTDEIGKIRRQQDKLQSHKQWGQRLKPSIQKQRDREHAELETQAEKLRTERADVQRQQQELRGSNANLAALDRVTRKHIRDRQKAGNALPGDDVTLRMINESLGVKTAPLSFDTPCYNRGV